MDKLIDMSEQLNSYVWGPYLIIALLFTGTWILVRTKFLPFTHIFLIIRKTIGSLRQQDRKQGITSFQAVSTALAGTLGVGSIVGVATAITMGGPGALFWMCCSAIVGMMSKYAEVVLAIQYRVKRSDGSYLGGPMTTLEHGCRLPFLGVLFAVLCIFASFGIGNITPANTIMESISSYIPVSSVFIGVLLALVVGSIIFGKGNAIMRFNEITIPIISIIYIVACVYLITINGDKVLSVCKLIVSDAWSISSGIYGVGGFMLSKALRFGISRGVFSNEAGMGSSPISHASVANVCAVEQGFWGIFEVFFDTIVVCLLTGFVILTSGLYTSGFDGAALTIQCFAQGFGPFGGMLFALSIISFAIPSIVGWYYYARECFKYLFKSNIALHIYQFVFLALLVVAPMLQLDLVWNIADTLNGLMAVPNLISILILNKVVVKLTKEYLAHA